MNRLKQILDGMIEDLEGSPGNANVSYIVADRMRRYRKELEGSGHLTDSNEPDKMT